jgi:hypothetical protein
VKAFNLSRKMLGLLGSMATEPSKLIPPAKPARGQAGKGQKQEEQK